MTSTDVDIAIAAVMAGARIIRRDYGSKHERMMKSATDYTTQTDLDAEEAILGVISRAFPFDAVSSEERGEAGSNDSGRRWLVDPLCGTANFASTTPLVAVNVALTVAGTVTVAAVADPIANELFWTDRERTFTRLDGQAVLAVPTDTSRLIEVNCDGPADVAFVGGQIIADPRLREAFSARVISSTLALPWTAVGRRAAYVSDGCFRDNLHYAAGIAVCERAGCVVSDLAGDPLHTGPGLIVSAGPTTHEAVVRLVSPYLADVQPAQ